jgi:hypothetical protein
MPRRLKGLLPLIATKNKNPLFYKKVCKKLFTQEFLINQKGYLITTFCYFPSVVIFRLLLFSVCCYFPSVVIHSLNKKENQTKKRIDLFLFKNSFGLLLLKAE